MKLLRIAIPSVVVVLMLGLYVFSMQQSDLKPSDKEKAGNAITPSSSRGPGNESTGQRDQRLRVESSDQPRFKKNGKEEPIMNLGSLASIPGPTNRSQDKQPD